MEAPFTITQKAVEVCNRHDISTRSFESVLKPKNNKLILIGDNYVIANDFRNHSDKG